MPGNEVACLHGDTSDAQRRLQAGETFDMVIPATHWIIRSCRTHGLPTVGASFVMAYRSLLVLACYVMRLPADRSMHDSFWHSLMIRGAWFAALFDAAEGELGSRVFTSIATAISHAAIVIKASSTPAVLAAREATAQSFFALQPAPAPHLRGGAAWYCEVRLSDLDLHGNNEIEAAAFLAVLVLDGFMTARRALPAGAHISSCEDLAEAVFANSTAPADDHKKAKHIIAYFARKMPALPFVVIPEATRVFTYVLDIRSVKTPDDFLLFCWRNGWRCLSSISDMLPQSDANAAYGHVSHLLKGKIDIPLIISLDAAISPTIAALPSSVAAGASDCDRRDAVAALISRLPGDLREPSAQRSSLQLTASSADHAALMAVLLPLNVTPLDTTAVAAVLMRFSMGLWFLNATSAERAKLTYNPVWESIKQVNFADCQNALNVAICTVGLGPSAVARPDWITVSGPLSLDVCTRIVKFGLRNGPGGSGTEPEPPEFKGETINIYRDIITPLLEASHPGGHGMPTAVGPHGLNWRMLWRHKEVMLKASPIILKVMSAVGYDIVSPRSVGSLFQNNSTIQDAVELLPQKNCLQLPTIEYDINELLGHLAESTQAAFDENASARKLVVNSSYGSQVSRVDFVGGSKFIASRRLLDSKLAECQSAASKMQLSNKLFQLPASGSSLQHEQVASQLTSAFARIDQLAAQNKSLAGQLNAMASGPSNKAPAGRTNSASSAPSQPSTTAPAATVGTASGRLDTPVSSVTGVGSLAGGITWASDTRLKVVDPATGVEHTVDFSATGGSSVGRLGAGVTGRHSHSALFERGFLPPLCSPPPPIAIGISHRHWSTGF